MRNRFRFDRSRRRAAGRAKAAMPVITLAIAAVVSGCGTASQPHAAGQSHAAAPSPPALPGRVSATEMARLPMATTFGTTPAAPRDPAPSAAETGIVLHPTATLVVYARPGGPPVAALPATE